jgi:hypothetical protein
VPKLKFQLPIAPPLNNAFFNVPGAGRKKTSRYRRWIKDADAHYVLQGLQRATKITTGYIVKMTFPKDLRGDIDGRGKLILDWLVSRNLTIDDKHCKRLLLEYGDWNCHEYADVVEIEVEPHPDETIQDR